MPEADFFARLGLFTVKGFFDRPTCQRIRADLRASAAKPAAVFEEDGTQAVDKYTRQTALVEAPPSDVDAVQSRLVTIQPTLGAAFQLELRGCATPQFLRYQPGDFFRAHQDVSDGPRPDYVKQRRVSVVIFLNQEGPETDDSYSGGSLTFYGLMKGAAWERIGLPLVAEEGLLVGFRSDVLHEVTPVERGERYTIVSWFH